MTSVYYVDGQYHTGDPACIPVNDLSVIRGYGVFDFTRTYGKKPFQLEAHIARLFRSAEMLMLDVPWSQDEIAAIVHQALSYSAYPEANVRIIITGGVTLDSLNPAEGPRLIVIVTPVSLIAPEDYANGVKIITVAEDRFMPTAKSINYIPAILALKAARAQGALDAIYVDSAGRALEGTTNNLFAFFGDTLVTPENGILHGITRGVVLELARSVFRVEIRDLMLDEVYHADETFLTSSIKQVLSVVRINDRIIGAGIPGERTRRMMQLFAEMTGVPFGV